MAKGSRPTPTPTIQSAHESNEPFSFLLSNPTLHPIFRCIVTFCAQYLISVVLS